MRPIEKTDGAAAIDVGGSSGQGIRASLNEPL
jgi:hypothetical protein